MLLWAPLMWLQVPSSFAQALFDRPPTRVMIHNPQSTEGLRNRTTISVVVSEDSGHSLGAIVLRQLPILISGIGVAWSLGFASATVPFVAKENGAWLPLLL